MTRHQSRLGPQPFTTVPRANVVLAGPFIPVDNQGNNGDYFMVIGTNNTFIMFGPKANGTWTGAPECIFSNQLQPLLVYLPFSGDLPPGFGVSSMPSSTSGVPGQYCLALDGNNFCGGIYLKTASSWQPLVQGFNNLNVVNGVGVTNNPPASGTPESGN